MMNRVWLRSVTAGFIASGAVACAQTNSNQIPAVPAEAPSSEAVPIPEFPSAEELRTEQTGWLRDPPFYVTDDNRYFVIVASPESEQEGLRKLDELKSTSPDYDFHLYPPYGANTHYAVMIASWVSRDLAYEVLGIAKRDVASDAYPWRCRSRGDSC